MTDRIDHHVLRKNASTLLAEIRRHGSELIDQIIILKSKLNMTQKRLDAYKNKYDRLKKHMHEIDERNRLSKIPLKEIDKIDWHD